jgi:hypothetical protein
MIPRSVPRPPWLSPQIRIALLLFVLVTTAAVAGWLGYALASAQGDAALARSNAQHAKEKETLAIQHLDQRAAQESAWREQFQTAQVDAQKRLRTLAERENALQARQQKLRQEVLRHVSRPAADAACVSGFDDAWLRNYNAAYGLPADAAEPVGGSATQGAGAAGKAAATDAGLRRLSAADILTHASDVGLWCQTLELRLQEVIGE